MTVRDRRPTDQDGTGVYDPERRGALFGASPGDRIAVPAVTAAAAAPVPDSWDHDATEVGPRSAAPPAAPAIDQPTPTHIDPHPPIEQGTPTELRARPERSEPIRVFSMKDHTETARPRTEPRVPLHVQLRSMAEVAGLSDPRNDLGHLAPPRDPRQALRRRRRDNLLWACVAIALAGAISLAIWLVAGR